MSGASSEAERLATEALERLFKAGSRQDAGVSSRAPALTESRLVPYRGLPSLKDKESFEAVMLHAQAEGAVRLVRPRHDPAGMIERVELVDLERLAIVLGRPTHAAIVANAQARLQPWLASFPLLAEVVERWAKLKTVRSSGPERFQDWVDACRVINYCREQGESDIPVRDASARLFQDSKRIEALTAQLDVLLQDDLSTPPRPDFQVLQEIGLFREPLAAHMSGDLVVRRERGAFPLDRPYCALPPSTVISLESTPSRVLTVENLTTFHVQARALCDSDVLCIYTGGMPSPAWVAMYQRLLASVPLTVPIQHWGDMDEGGFRIAAFLARAAAQQGHCLRPERMAPTDVPPERCRLAEPGTVTRMVKFARAAGWDDLAAKLGQAGVVAEQEG